MGSTRASTTNQCDDYNTIRNEDTTSLFLAITVVVRPSLPLPPQLPPRGFATVLRITRVETLTDVRKAPSAPVTDRSTAVRSLQPIRRQHCRENKMRSAPTCPISPRALPRTSDRRSDPASPVSLKSPQASPLASGVRALNASPLSLSMRAGVSNAALPNHAPRSTKSVAPARRFIQRGDSSSSSPGHAVAVGLRCGKADTETPRSQLKLDFAFPRNNGGRSTLFPGKEESTRLVVSPSFPTRSTGRKPSPVDHLLPLTPAPFLKSATGCLQALFRRARHSTCAALLRLQGYRRNPTLPVESVVTPRPPVRSTGQHTRKNRKRKSQPSSRRTDSKSPAPFGLGQRPSGAV